MTGSSPARHLAASSGFSRAFWRPTSQHLIRPLSGPSQVCSQDRPVRIGALILQVTRMGFPSESAAVPDDPAQDQQMAYFGVRGHLVGVEALVFVVATDDPASGDAA